MKAINYYPLVILCLFSCSPEVEPDLDSELFQLTINPSLEVLSISENGRLESDSSATDSIFTDLYFQLFDSECNEMDSESKMFYNTSIPQIVLPNLSAGTYYYKIKVDGQAGISYDSASSFSLQSDTILEASLENRQMRYRFKEISEFDVPNVHRVSYILNFSTAYWYHYSDCSPGEWHEDNYDGYIDQTSYNNSFNTDFNYNYPIDIKSVTVKFYDHDNNVIKIHNIPIVKELLKHHSYSFEINLSAIWTNNPNGSSIEVNVVDVEWTEETIDLNG